MGNQTTKSEEQTFTFFQKKENNEYKQMKGDLSKHCKCSYKTRIIGYIVCFVIGWLLSIIASIFLLAKHNVVVFSVLFSIGQIINVTGSCFLATPKTQIKSMFIKARIWFTIAYLSSTIITIVLAVTLPEHLRYLVIISLLVQVASYFFYTLSYIPYGRKILGKVFTVMIDKD